MILNLKSGVYFGLDEVGAKVWGLLAKPRRVSEIREALLDLYEVDAERCAGELLELPDELQSRGLIEVCDEPGR